MRAALASAERGGRITTAEHDRGKRSFAVVWNDIAKIECESRVADAAGYLAESQGLRGFDAVHLASALTAHAGNPLYMLTYDDELARASCDCGINVIRADGA